MPSAPAEPLPTLKRGARGAAVRTMTGLLAERGHLDAARPTFDWAVKHAVEEFQARHLDSRGRPLTADGIVGPLTWWALQHPKKPTFEPQWPVGSRLPRGGSAAGRAALAAALDELRTGAREQRVNNDGQWVAKYLNGVVPPPANWCAGFVSWCFSQAPGGIPFRYSLGARAIRDDFRRRGWVYDPQAQMPAPGDIVVWWRGQPTGWQGHIGLVHHVDNGILFTVEGNKGGFPAPVGMFDYVLGRMERLLGFGRVPF